MKLNFVDLKEKIENIHFNTKKILTVAAVILGVLFVSALVLYHYKDRIITAYVLEKKQEIEKDKGIKINYRDFRVLGISGVSLQDLSIVPNDRDTLLRAKSISVKISLWHLLFRDIKINEFNTDDFNLTFIKKDSISNYDFLFKKKNNPEQQTKKGYGNRVSTLLKVIFNALPSNGLINNMKVSILRDTNYTELRIPNMEIDGSHFHTDLIVKEGGKKYDWICSGEFNRGNKEMEGNLSASDGKKVIIPYINHYYKLDVGFNRLDFKLKEENHPGMVTLKGKASVRGLSVYNPMLSPNVVNLDDGSLDYKFNIGKDYFEVDKETDAHFNKMDFNPYIRAQKENKKWHITVGIDKPWFPADDLFESLPPGLFSNLDGFRATGELQYHFLFDLDFNDINHLKLESSLNKRNFSILNFGAGNLAKMNDPFLYTAYEKGKPVKSFIVGPQYAHYRSLNQISPLLQNAVMQSEDGMFMTHQGFRLDAMILALKHDLQVKKFARGGSTISMQLVKNVFLNRNKNLLRKLEESFIVWLIEANHITSKQRMLEVYLNICEWGPMIYGAYEASHFYFGKDPSQLNLEEAIFMAAVIPKPKHYMSFFTPDGHLRHYMGWYYRFVARKMADKGVISRAQANSVVPYVNITGPAGRHFVHIPDSISVPDSSANPLEEEIINEAPPENNNENNKGWF